MITNPADREAEFQRYLENKKAYDARIIENGDILRKPWFETIDQQRELFMRRYIRPAPPAGIPSKTLVQIRGERNVGYEPGQRDILEAA